MNDTNNTLVLAIVNTTSSINLDLARKISYQGHYDLIDFNVYKDDLPVLSTDLLHEKRIPDHIRQIHLEIIKYKNIIIVTPEHNGYFSAFAKNILDWLSRVDNKYFLDKNIVLAVASPGAKGGQSLREFAQITLKFTGAKTVNNFGFGGYSVDGDANSMIQKVVDYIEDLE